MFDKVIGSLIPGADINNPKEAVWHHASASFDQEEVAFHYSSTLQGVWYLAFPSMNTTADDELVVARIAKCLPGESLHQGSAIYWIDIPHIAGMIFVVKIDLENRRISTRVMEKDQESLQTYAISLPIVEVDWQGDAVQITRFNLSRIELQHNLFSGVLWTGVIAFSFSLLFLFYQIMMNQFGQENKISEVLTNQSNVIDQAVAQINAKQTASGLQTSFSALDEISKLALKYEGKVEYYSWEKGRVRWGMLVPLWASSPGNFPPEAKLERKDMFILVKKD